MLSAWLNRLLTLRARNVAPVLLALICLTLVATRLGGDHLHLCLEGKCEEPASSIHLVDSAVHHADGVGEHGDDVDVDIAHAALGLKASAMGGDFPLLIFAVLVLFLTCTHRREGIPPGRDTLVRPLPTFRILPPLRAPPR